MKYITDAAEWDSLTLEARDEYLHEGFQQEGPVRNYTGHRARLVDVLQSQPLAFREHWAQIVLKLLVRSSASAAHGWPVPPNLSALMLAPLDIMVEAAVLALVPKQAIKAEFMSMLQRADEKGG